MPSGLWRHLEMWAGSTKSPGTCPGSTKKGSETGQIPCLHFNGTLPCNFSKLIALHGIRRWIPSGVVIYCPWISQVTFFLFSLFSSYLFLIFSLYKNIFHRDAVERVISLTCCFIRGWTAACDWTDRQTPDVWDLFNISATPEPFWSYRLPFSNKRCLW